MRFLFSFLCGLLCAVFPDFRDTSFRRGCFPLFAAALLPRLSEPASLVLPVLIAASVCDMRTGQIPDTCHLLFVVTAYRSGVLYVNDALICFGLLSCLALTGRLGFGDVKYVSAMVLLYGRTGFLILPAACTAALPYCLLRKRSADIPFAPFLSVVFFILLTCFPEAG